MQHGVSITEHCGGGGASVKTLIFLSIPFRSGFCVSQLGVRYFRTIHDLIF